jgi:hypothetical protein
VVGGIEGTIYCIKLDLSKWFESLIYIL